LSVKNVSKINSHISERILVTGHHSSPIDERTAASQLQAFETEFGIFFNILFNRNQYLIESIRNRSWNGG
jgi:hypothetical protein